MHPFSGNEIRRIKKLHFDPQVFIDSLVEGNVVRVSRGLPAGTKYTGYYFDYFQVLWFMLFNEAWDEVPRGQEIPEIESPVLERVREEK